MSESFEDRASRLASEAQGLSGDARSSFLSSIEEDALRRRVQSLLDDEETREGDVTLNTSSETAIHLGDPGEAGATPGPSGSSLVGHRVGSYLIQGVIGEGGMGVVYRATQERPNRQVALKLIRPGHATSQHRRRFEFEAELLGRLSHPGIAQIHEAGIDEATGSAYFAMELIEGEDLTTYLAHRTLGTRERLRLFAEICRAVQHAHSKGVIHRDLKPSNILVTEVGDPPRAQPKILDFGVARLTDADTRSATLRTDIGQLIGTVPYMSREQGTGDPDALDTRSDVYALGVVLYEVLLGRLPYDLSNRLIHEAVRVIREDEPTRLSSVNPSLRGDVETIVMKALEKERDRRYQSAGDLATDIDRYLTDEPIAARPASTWYQVRKFSRRHRALVGGVAATFVVLVLGIIGTTWFALRAEERRVEAELASEAASLAEAASRRSEAETAARAEDLAVVASFQSAQLAGIDASVMGARLRDDLLMKVREQASMLGEDPEAVDARIASIESMIAGTDFT
ncbi:MAG: serine/threonine protein kinase, partial [Phycisphaerales bacterium]|nr:serine/threonine protein kinase [Phycisphaerales bacterium]